jgi:hypothetical protein
MSSHSGSVNKKAGYWPKASIEHMKLSNKENDWKIEKGDGVKSRTRGGGNGRPSRLVQTEMRKLEWLDPESSESSQGEDDEDDFDDSSYEGEEVEDVDLEYDVLDIKAKPATASRAIIEVDALIEGFEKNCHCMTCSGPVLASVESVCLATSFMLSCKNPTCGYVYHSNPPAVARIPAPDNRERTTDYAVNVLFVLGVIASGDGVGCNI